MNKKNKIKEFGENDIAIAEFNGASVRKWAEDVRKSGKGIPKVYKFIDSAPVRSKDGKKVIVEGTWKLGVYIDGKPKTMQIWIAQFGYKLPTTGTAKRCDELVELYKSALNQTGKFAPKAKKSAKSAKKSNKKSNKKSSK